MILNYVYMCEHRFSEATNVRPPLGAGVSDNCKMSMGLGINLESCKISLHSSPQSHLFTHTPCISFVYLKLFVNYYLLVRF